MSYLIILLFGLVMGSFINVCIHRLPRNESIIHPSSHCPSCERPIRIYDNIPLISFILLKGRCRFCQAKIPLRYPWVEFIHGVGAISMAHQFSLSWAALIYFLFFSSLVAVAFIDLSHQIVPDVITLPGMVCGLMASSMVLPPGFMGALVGLLVGGGLFYLIAILSVVLLKKEGMGGGDIKLIAMIGAFLGWQEVLITIFLAALLGSIVGLSLIVFCGRSRSDPIPFGPFLALGAVSSLFLGGEILKQYLSIGRM